MTELECSLFNMQSTMNPSSSPQSINSRKSYYSSLLKAPNSSRHSRFSRDRSNNSHSNNNIDDDASVVSGTSTIASVRSFTIQQLTSPVKPLALLSQLQGSARPPSRRVDDGDDEPSIHVRPQPSLVKPEMTAAAAAAAAPTTIPATNTTNASPDFTYLVGNESIVSYTSHYSTWDDELDDMSFASHSIATTISGRRPPPPMRGGSSHHHSSSRRSITNSDSVRSLASYSTRDWDAQSMATTTTATSSHYQSPQRTNNNNTSTSTSASTSPTMTIATPPYLMRNTTQSSIRKSRLEREDSFKSQSTSSGMLMAANTRESGSSNHRATMERMIVRTKVKQQQPKNDVQPPQQQQQHYQASINVSAFAPPPPPPPPSRELLLQHASAAMRKEETALQQQVNETNIDASWQPKGFSFRPFRRASM
ncbi:hypothetical protein MPSEU_001076500 [Mayamaea pseudoterrestris]|nr:hypothetical protein MPSEU_001076500 [Mayamaea pseudoterrestris]